MDAEPLNTISDRARAAMRAGEAPRAIVVGLMGFLTLVDLFAAQAILPSLVKTYGVTSAAMGFAVNASTIGMAAAGLLVSLLARRVDPRRGVWVSLALLSIPTTLLAYAPDLGTFAALRIAQGVFMAAAFTLTMAYLADRAWPLDAAAALAAYVTGVVASNLFGRLLSGSVADIAGVAANFYVFAGLNLAGAALAAATLSPALKMPPLCRPLQSPLVAWAQHLANPALRAAFGIGFLILFVFIGVFTYVNFELTKAPLSLSPMSLGLVYLVFLPSLVTTPLAGRAVGRWGIAPVLQASMLLCLAASPLLVSSSLVGVIVSLALFAGGTFFAQAAATGFVGRAAQSDRAAASGLYLTAYYLGGVIGALVVGQVYDRLGWPAAVAAVDVALVAAMLLGARLGRAAPAARKPFPNRRPAMRTFIIALAAVLVCSAAIADTESDVRAAYLRFAEAQNARDLDWVRGEFVDDPEFLWVSDGKSFWGRDAVLARMGSFQRAEVWRVEPDIDASTVVELGADAALLHMPLTLVIGQAEKPNRLRFLVSIVFVRRSEDWRIAALLTTNEKP